MNTNDMPVIRLEGTPWERGRYLGEVGQPIIDKIVKNWRADFGNFGKNSSDSPTLDPGRYLSDFLSKTNYFRSIERWAPDLLEESRGIAEGSGQTFDNILGLQLMDEEWIFGLRRQLEKPTTKCTAFGLPSQVNNTSFSGQNMDIGSWVDGCQTLLRVMPTKNSPEALVFSFAGCIGLNGLNANGLGVTCNTLAQLDHSIHGLPVAFIVRKILAQNSIDKAEEFLRGIEHASGQNYILSSPGDMRCFECSSKTVIRYTPKNLNGRVFHTNHPLASGGNSHTNLASSPVENSQARLNSIKSRLGCVSSLHILDDVKQALAAHDDPANPVSRNENNEGSSIGFTAGSSIYEFSAVPRLHLAAGPPCETEFKVFEFQSIA